jgi:hypothetical protein
MATLLTMAQKTHVFLEDDLTGGDADETVTFGLDGRAYEIDLSSKNAEELRASLSRYVSAGRRAGKAHGFKSPFRRADSEPDPAAIRAWAYEQGYEVSSRGRISGALVSAYKDAGN